MAEQVHQVPAQSAILVEYPGYVRNKARAVETLGSEGALHECIRQNAGFLKLRQRPSDPFCHAIFGERHGTAGLVLRISRKRGDEAAPVKVQVAARVERAYKFNALSDYQYLPLHDGKVRPTTVSGAGGSEQVEPFNAKQPLLLVPPLFTRADVALDYAFKQVRGKPAGGHLRRRGAAGRRESTLLPAARATAAASQLQPGAAAAAAAAAACVAARTTPPCSAGQTPRLHLVTLAGASPAAADTFSFSFYALAVPPAPAYEAQEGEGTVGAALAPAFAAAAAAAAAAAPGTLRLSWHRSHELRLTARAQWQTANMTPPPPGDTSLEAQLHSALQQRPIYSRYMLGRALAAAQPSHAGLEPLVRKHCYAFKTGPFRTLLVRRGFDPRSDKGSRRYQVAR
jgi:hypothetical protein